MRFALLLFLAVLAACGQTETILFGAVDLRLGMPKAQAKARVCERYTSFCAEQLAWLWEGDFLMVGDRESKHLIGDLQFANGKLVGVSKDWTPREGTDEMTFVKAFYSLVSDLNQQGKRFATVDARIVRTQDITTEIVELSFGSRSIRITRYEGEIVDSRVHGVRLFEDYSVDPATSLTRRPKDKAAQSQK